MAAVPFAALNLIDIYDLESDQLRAVLAGLDAFFASAVPDAPGAAQARRQRECAALELEERGLSAMIVHAVQPASIAMPPPPPAWRPPPSTPTAKPSSTAAVAARPAWLTPSCRTHGERSELSLIHI